MKAEYIQELYDTLDHARKIKGVYKSWERSKTGFKYPEKGAAYKNYLLIVCYGKIEHVFKNILADYFTKSGMPQKCVQFGNKIRDKLPGSMARDKLNKYIKEECSEAWFSEIKRRTDDPAHRCKRKRDYSFSDAYMAVTSLTNARHKFAHGETPYTGSIDDLLLYYIKSIVWLYEIDDIINTVG